ncbi:hypothetical protein BC835DRAFT_756148 [Cytidiella melzeri]|nr:hypothetical protein BC835DRAFT_756148 [Cytidiella melzeri]
MNVLPARDTFANPTRKSSHANANASRQVNRKSWRSRRISRILGRDTRRCENYPACSACPRCLPHRRQRTVRLINLNRLTGHLSWRRGTLQNYRS